MTTPKHGYNTILRQKIKAVGKIHGANIITDTQEQLAL